jgi:putative addiction module component (TIGR02574 family)
MCVTTETEQVLEAALKLPREEREELMVLLADTLEEGTSEELEAAWIDEAKRRLAALRSGETKPIPWDRAEKRLFGTRQRA